MAHLILLGDSVFDNGAHVGGGPDVRAQVQALLAPGERVSLRAMDGAATEGVPAQMQSLPADASCLVLSAGGNDALRHIGQLDAEVASNTEALLRIDAARHAFECSYRALVDTLLVRGLPLVLCTVYDANFEVDAVRRCSRVVIAAFDDVIIRVAIEQRLCLIDLRAVCHEPADYANAIEPSVQGGAKIARAVVHAARAAMAQPAGMRVFADVPQRPQKL